MRAPVELPLGPREAYGFEREGGADSLDLKATLAVQKSVSVEDTQGALMHRGLRSLDDKVGQVGIRQPVKLCEDTSQTCALT